MFGWLSCISCGSVGLISDPSQLWPYDLSIDDNFKFGNIIRYECKRDHIMLTKQKTYYSGSMWSNLSSFC